MMTKRSFDHAHEALAILEAGAGRHASWFRASYPGLTRGLVHTFTRNEVGKFSRAQGVPATSDSDMKVKSWTHLTSGWHESPPNSPNSDVHQRAP